MSAIYVFGGRMKPGAQSLEIHNRFEKAVVVRVSPDGKSGRTVFEYKSPPEICEPGDPSHVFGAAHIEGEEVLIPTKTEVLIRGFPDFEARGSISLPCFNDLHHVTPTPAGSLMVANTGLDQVVECTRSGETLRSWNVAGHESPWGDKFDGERDYRLVPSTKPHANHPNYVFSIGEEWWVTRFKQRDAVSLDDPERRMPIDVQGCHDGHLVDGQVWFTTVNGHVVVVDAESLQVTANHDLNAIDGSLRKLGWCRGIHVIDRRRAIVGFSRLRLTKWSENLKWVEGGLNTIRTLSHRPTRISLFDFDNSRIDWEYQFDDLDAVFSIHMVD